jgi:two-component system, chemotaxis family, chemotaxis protein CheY
MGKNILIVDDSPTLRASVNLVLTEAGFTVVQAENGRKGLAKLKELYDKGDRVNLIISDVNMPEMGGIEFVKNVKEESSSFRYVPVIFLTTETEETLKSKGREYGAAGWMNKPFKSDLLLKVVQKFVR